MAENVDATAEFYSQHENLLIWWRLTQTFGKIKAMSQKNNNTKKKKGKKVVQSFKNKQEEEDASASDDEEQQQKSEDEDADEQEQEVADEQEEEEEHEEEDLNGSPIEVLRHLARPYGSLPGSSPQCWPTSRYDRMCGRGIHFPPKSNTYLHSEHTFNIDDHFLFGVVCRPNSRNANTGAQTLAHFGAPKNGSQKQGILLQLVQFNFKFTNLRTGQTITIPLSKNTEPLPEMFRGEEVFALSFRISVGKKEISCVVNGRKLHSLPFSCNAHDVRGLFVLGCWYTGNNTEQHYHGVVYETIAIVDFEDPSKMNKYFIEKWKLNLMKDIEAEARIKALETNGKEKLRKKKKKK